jgi:hypothetical protein
VAVLARSLTGGVRFPLVAISATFNPVAPYGSQKIDARENKFFSLRSSSKAPDFLTQARKVAGSIPVGYIF